MDLFDLSALRLGEYIAANFYLNAVDGCSIATRPKFEISMNAKFPYERLNLDAVDAWRADVGRTSNAAPPCQLMHPGVVILATRGVDPENQTEENCNVFLRRFFRRINIQPEIIRGGVALTDKKVIAGAFLYGGAIGIRIETRAENEAWRQLVLTQCNEAEFLGVKDIDPTITINQVKAAAQLAASVAFDIDFEVKLIEQIRPEFEVFIKTFDRDSWIRQGIY